MILSPHPLFLLTKFAYPKVYPLGQRGKPPQRTAAFMWEASHIKRPLNSRLSLIP